MQNRYTGDVGDFSKYALLNALSTADIRLGLMWYLNESEESNSDGRFTKYGNLEYCDSALCKKLSNILQNSQRNLVAVETDEILPPGTLFYRERLAFPRKVCFTSASRAQQTELREAWFVNGLHQLCDRELIFLDPDNGVASSRVKKYSPKSVKYAFVDEINRWLTRKQSVVLYQHQKRQSLEAQISEQLNEFGKSGWALSFHRLSVRIYYILPATAEHRQMLWQRCNAFLATQWGLGGHFRLHDGS